jgi:hypothetical protein
VRNNDSEASRSTSKGSTISYLGFHVANDSTFGYLLQREDIPNVKSSLLSTVDELASVHSLGSNHEFSITFETVSVQELNLGDGGTTTRIMEDLLDDSADVSVAFGIVDGAKFDSSLAGGVVRFEDGGLTLPLALLF